MDTKVRLLRTAIWQWLTIMNTNKASAIYILHWIASQTYEINVPIEKTDLFVALVYWILSIACGFVIYIFSWKTLFINFYLEERYNIIIKLDYHFKSLEERNQNQFGYSKYFLRKKRNIFYDILMYIELNLSS